MAPAAASFHAGELGPNVMSRVAGQFEYTKDERTIRTSFQDLLGLVVCPEAAHGVGHLPEQRRADAVEEAPDPYFPGTGRKCVCCDQWRCTIIPAVRTVFRSDWIMPFGYGKVSDRRP